MSKPKFEVGEKVKIISQEKMSELIQKGFRPYGGWGTSMPMYAGSVATITRLVRPSVARLNIDSEGYTWDARLLEKIHENLTKEELLNLFVNKKITEQNFKEEYLKIKDLIDGKTFEKE